MDYDGIKLCEQCGEYTTGRLCTSCQQQEMIDNDDLSGYYPAVEFDEPPITDLDTVKLEPLSPLEEPKKL